MVTWHKSIPIKFEILTNHLLIEPECVTKNKSLGTIGELPT